MKPIKRLAVPILVGSVFCLSTAAWAESENVKLKSFQEVPAVSSAASGHPLAGPCQGVNKYRLARWVASTYQITNRRHLLSTEANRARFLTLPAAN